MESAGDNISGMITVPLKLRFSKVQSVSFSIRRRHSLVTLPKKGRKKTSSHKNYLLSAIQILHKPLFSNSINKVVSLIQVHLAIIGHILQSCTASS